MSRLFVCANLVVIGQIPLPTYNNKTTTTTAQKGGIVLRMANIEVLNLLASQIFFPQILWRRMDFHHLMTVWHLDNPPHSTQNGSFPCYCTLTQTQLTYHYICISWTRMLFWRCFLSTRWHRLTRRSHLFCAGPSLSPFKKAFKGERIFCPFLAHSCHLQLSEAVLQTIRHCRLDVEIESHFWVLWR